MMVEPHRHDQYRLLEDSERVRVTNVKSHGAKGDGVCDDTLAIQAAIAAAGTGMVVFPDDGGGNSYLVTSGLVFNEGVIPYVEGGAKIVYNGTGAAVTFREWADGEYVGPARVAVKKTAPAWWGGDTTSRGVVFENCFRMNVDLPLVYGYRVGVEFVGDGNVGAGGTSYIDVALGSIVENRVGLLASPSNGGWVSAINLNGGVVRLDDIGQSTNAGTRYVQGPFWLSKFDGVMLESVCVEKAVELSASGGGDGQANTFLQCSFEGNGAGAIDLGAVGSNLFIGCPYVDYTPSSILVGVGAPYATVFGFNNEWAAYTPTLGGTGAAVGNGSLTGRFVNRGGVVHFWAALLFGSTTTVASAGNETTISLPVSNPVYYTADIRAHGNDTGYSPWVFAVVASATEARLFCHSATGQLTQAVDATHPFAWGNNCSLVVVGTYESL